jgi:hypothetical protein
MHDHLVAIKKIPAKNIEQEQAFQKEVKVMKNVNNTKVIRLYG